MAPISTGDALPDGTLAYFDEQDQLQHVSVHSLAAGKKVILFGVPGAFTPTCRYCCCWYSSFSIFRSGSDAYYWYKVGKCMTIEVLYVHGTWVGSILILTAIYESVKLQLEACTGVHRESRGTEVKGCRWDSVPQWYIFSFLSLLLWSFLV